MGASTPKKLSWTDSVNLRFQHLVQLTLDSMGLAVCLADGLKDRTTRLAAVEMLLLRDGLITEEKYKAAIAEVEAGRAVDLALDPERQRLEAELSRLNSELQGLTKARTRRKARGG